MGKLNIPEEITLVDVIPIVKALPFPERQVLKQLLDKSDEEWAQKLDKCRAEFHEAFSRYPEDEVEADLKQALERVRPVGRSRVRPGE